MPAYEKKVPVPGKSAQELYDVVAKDIDRVIEKGTLGDRAKIHRNPEERWIEIEGGMFSARLYCRDGLLDLQGKLSLMAMPFKGKIDEGITKWLTKTFNLTA